MVLTSRARKTKIRNRLFLVACISELDRPIHGVSRVNAIIFLAMHDGLPFDYDFDNLGEGMVDSKNLFSDLMDLIDQGAIREEFEMTGEEVIPVLTSKLSGREALEYLEKNYGDELAEQTRKFIARIRKDVL
ncbi:MAG: hypothetical protein RTS72_02240, partial [Candidatus Thorarchaeota archaeon]